MIQLQLCLLVHLIHAGHCMQWSPYIVAIPVSYYAFTFNFKGTVHFTYPSDCLWEASLYLTQGMECAAGSVPFG